MLTSSCWWRVKLVLYAYECSVAIGTAIYTSPEALSPQNTSKVSKRSSRASLPGVPKKCRKSPKGPEKESKRTRKWVFGDFFDTFLTLWAGRPGKTFLRLLGISGLRAVETPVYGDCNRKCSGLSSPTQHANNRQWPEDPTLEGYTHRHSLVQGQCNLLCLWWWQWW